MNLLIAKKYWCINGIITAPLSLAVLYSFQVIDVFSFSYSLPNFPLMIRTKTSHSDAALMHSSMTSFEGLITILPASNAIGSNPQLYSRLYNEDRKSLKVG
jgi:hypothetical protein